MANQNRDEQWRRADERVAEKLPPGVKFVRSLRGHTGQIGRIAWSPNGRMLASPSTDKMIRLWDAETGECLRTMKGHSEAVTCVAFDPAGRILASGSSDGTIKLWDASSGGVQKTLDGHTQPVFGLSWSKDGRWLASASPDTTIRVWNTSTWSLSHVISTGAPRADVMLGVAWASDSKRLASASYDAWIWEATTGKQIARLKSGGGFYNVAWSPDPGSQWLAAACSLSTVVIWESARWRQARVLEGHSGSVRSVNFSSDGQLLASSSEDGTIRLWSCRDWREVASIIEDPQSVKVHQQLRVGVGRAGEGICFHPLLPLLATGGSDHGTPYGDPNRVIHIYELDLAALLGQPGAPTVTYTSAKVVLVGESNVGKSYLAHRIATDKPPKKGTIKSTHGMRFWPLEPERLSPLSAAPAGQRRDVVLWDMGGQEEYRLIHQLFLHDTTVALLLFDPTRGATAFKEVETWNKYLERQLRGRAAAKLLVGAKLDEPNNTIDRGGVVRLVKDCGFADYYETSAITGRGLTELCEAVAKAIDWDGLGQTSRPELFQRVSDEIEARRRRGEVVISDSELHKALGYKDLRGRKTAVHAVSQQLGPEKQ